MQKTYKTYDDHYADVHNRHRSLNVQVALKGLAFLSRSHNLSLFQLLLASGRFVQDIQD